MAEDLYPKSVGKRIWRLLGFLGILVGLAIIIALIVLFKPCGNSTCPHVKGDTSVELTNAEDEHVVMSTEGVYTLTEGSTETISCDPVEINRDSSVSYQRKAEVEDAHVYICKEPCSWADVKAHTSLSDWYTTGMGLDERFSVTKNGKKGKWVKVTIADVTAEDSGVYRCAVDLMGQDWYQLITIETKPQSKAVKTMKSETEREVAAKRAVQLCNGNKACALAVIHKEELELTHPCWICMQFGNAWTVTPLLAKEAKESACFIPAQMTRVLRAPETLLQSEVPTKIQLNCSEPILTVSSGYTPFRIQPTEGDVCVCRHPSDATHNVGTSKCNHNIWIKDETGQMCSYFMNGMEVRFNCPFDMNWESSPAAVWVCGFKAYHDLPPFSWSGCCYPALLSVGTTVYTDSRTNKHATGVKREALSDMLNNMPDAFNGYTLYNHWTAPRSDVGWSVFIGGGTDVSMHKINALALGYLKLAEVIDTHKPGIDETKQIREMILQNRVALDMLISERQGICKFFNTSCCFHLPEHHDNVTDLIGHMIIAAIPQPPADPPRFGRLFGGWRNWLINTIMPVVVFFLFLIALLPCLLKSIRSMIVKALNAKSTSVPLSYAPPQPTHPIP